MFWASITPVWDHCDSAASLDRIIARDRTKLKNLSPYHYKVEGTMLQAGQRNYPLPLPPLLAMQASDARY
jgi:hypothetical protein